MKNKKLVWTVVAGLAVVAVGATVLISYFINRPTMPVPGDPLTFSGTVLAAVEDSIYVEAEEGQEFTKISVSVFDDTELVFEDGTAATFEDVEKGDKVTVTNYGLIALEYPAQTSAQKVVIAKQ